MVDITESVCVIIEWLTLLSRCVCDNRMVDITESLCLEIEWLTLLSRCVW